MQGSILGFSALTFNILIVTMEESPHTTSGPLLHTTHWASDKTQTRAPGPYIFVVEKYPQVPLKNSARGVERGQENVKIN